MYALIFKYLFFLVFSFTFLTCKKIKEENTEQKLKNIFVAQGYACWYGSAFEGKKTANGDVFSKNKLTAAHRYLEFGTKIKITNQKTQKSVVVEVNDRGPFVKGKILDLSEKAAKKIDVYAQGTGMVGIEIYGYKHVDFNFVLKHYRNILMIHSKRK
jgi:rare lipoprotein A